MHLQVEGRVQGVCFRMETCEQARRLGLTGWVRNRHDGAVEIEAQGRARDVAGLNEWCYRGPPLARVTRVLVDEVPTRERENGFTVRYDRGW
jgi:acylphosphatase